jgi:hypothetical protein
MIGLFVLPEFGKRFQNGKFNSAFTRSSLLRFGAWTA